MGGADVLYARVFVHGEQRVVLPVQAILSHVADSSCALAGARSTYRSTYSSTHVCTNTSACTAAHARAD
eukprot:CAMPEP_0115483414 /NCGR_PEP_ID=MMETSP0271-20121206/58842_1 /TAXON_ID=71861 /ORGANISM="Scrippsiella trochoidea, Strain CCMP3099" /LENGTH=68 /DNA_ID=CAMNT_0002911261 /DNA_START=205 /DNA_END=408 /DNA_ORIENTATION=-